MFQDEQTLTEIVKLLASVPEKSTFKHDLPQNHEWVGSVLNVLRQSDDITLSAEAKTIAAGLRERSARSRDPQPSLVVMLQQVKREFEFKVGYAIPRNYIIVADQDLDDVSSASSDLKEAIVQDNAIDPSDREIVLSEIAIFEASLGVARLSPDLIARFVNGILRGALLLAAGEAVKKACGDLADALFKLLEWPLSG